MLLGRRTLTISFPEAICSPNFHVALAEVRAGALVPRRARNNSSSPAPITRTGQRDDPSRPLLHHFPAGLRRDALDDARHEFG